MADGNPVAFADIIAAELAASFSATPPATVAIRLAAALVLGGMIGFEREVHARSAGLRTHILVAVAASLFALIAAEMVAQGVAAGADPGSADILRLVEAVTAGVAFLAAGSIITSGGRVRGLTTGAGMWMAGAVGLACGIGALLLAAMAALLTVIVLGLLGALTARTLPEDQC